MTAPHSICCCTAAQNSMRSPEAYSVDGGDRASVGLTHRERLQAGIRDLQAEMRRLAAELGPARLEGPGKYRAVVRTSTPPPEIGRLWGW